MAEKVLAYVKAHKKYDYESIIGGAFMRTEAEAELFGLIKVKVTRGLIEEKLFGNQYTKRMPPSDWGEDFVTGIGSEIQLYLDSEDDEERHDLLEVMAGKVLAYLEAFPDEADGINDSLHETFMNGVNKNELYKKLVSEVIRRLSEQKREIIKGAEASSGHQPAGRRRRLRNLFGLLRE